MFKFLFGFLEETKNVLPSFALGLNLGVGFHVWLDG